MKRTVVIIFISLLLLSCEGDRGPTGPQGPPGPPGASVVYLTGVISSSYYSQGWINFENSAIEADCVVQVYFSPDKDQYAWLFIPEFQLTNNTIYVYDNTQYYLDWDYMIMIIPNSGS